MNESWISVKDKLPGKDQDVIVHRESGVMCYTYTYENGRWFGYGSPYESKDITHWMPLPEPPKI